MVIQAPRIRLLLDEICSKLGGNWLLTGGALVLLEFDDKREAHNVDLVPIDPKEGVMALQRKIDSLSQPLGFTPAGVRAVATGYLNEVPDWRRYVVELNQGPSGRLLRPDLTLFTYLKLRRGTVKDISDLKSAIKKLGIKEFNVAALSAWAQARPDLLHRYVDNRLALGLPNLL